MTNLQKYTIAQVLRSSMWWMAIAPLYFLERGLTIEQFYLLPAIFSITMVVAEFPTGVLADKFSHKKAVIISGIGGILVQLAYAVPAHFYFYVVAFTVSGVVFAMNSGSDTAVLHKISNNFKKDLARVKTFTFIWIFFTTLIGGWLFTVNIIIPYLLSPITTFLAVLFFASIKVEDNNEPSKDSVYKLAIKSLKHLKGHRRLRGIFLMGSGLSALFFSYKWLLPVLFEIKNISVTHLNITLSIGMLFLAVGTMLSGSKYYVKLKYSVPLMLALLLFLGFGNSLIILAGITWSFYFLIAFFSVRMTVLTNRYTEDSIRASIMSLQSLVTRTFMAIYMVLIGKILGIWSPEVLSVFTFAILSIFVLYFIWTVTMSRHKNN